MGDSPVASLFSEWRRFFDGQPKTKRSVELKSETSRVLGEFTGFDALFSTRCKPALGPILIGLPN